MASSKPLGYWLKLLDHLIDKQFAETLDEHGVTRRQWQLLNVLAEGDATLAQLDAAVAPFLNPDLEETSSDHLAELIESAWVTTSANGFAVTEQGRGAFERLAEVVARNRDTLAEGIDPEDFNSTLNALERMARNLGWSE